MPDANRHIILNGEIFADTDPVVFHNNRAFCYGDALFETMHAYGTEIQFANDHFSRLYRGMQVLKMDISELLEPQKIKREIVRLLNRDKLFGGARIRIEVFRDSEGIYKPLQNKVSYIIEAKPLDDEHYELNTKGLAIDVFKDICKPVNIFSSFKTSNALLNVIAGIWAKEQGLDDCLILNDKGHIIEGYHSNLFLVKNNVLYTPSIEQGCVDGVMRKHVLEVADIQDIKIVENIKITEQALAEADEIFLSNAIEGIRWVGAYHQRRFFNKVARNLCLKLNEIAFDS